jgi:hypothetical protein
MPYYIEFAPGAPPSDAGRILGWSDGALMNFAGGAEIGSMEKERRHVRAGGIVTREIAGETILVPIRQGVGDLSCIFTLNETGSFLWGLIDGERSIDDLVQEVCEAFHVPDEAAARDVAGFLSEMEQAGLLRLAEPTER